MAAVCVYHMHMRVSAALSLSRSPACARAFCHLPRLPLWCRAAVARVGVPEQFEVAGVHAAHQADEVVRIIRLVVVVHAQGAIRASYAEGWRGLARDLQPQPHVFGCSEVQSAHHVSEVGLQALKPPDEVVRGPVRPPKPA